MSVQVIVNGETRDLPSGITAAGLIESLGLTGKRLALELNGEIVPKSAHERTGFRKGDRVEIVHAVGGG